MRGWKLRYIGIAYFYGVPMYFFGGYIGIIYFRGIPMYLEYCQNKIHRNSGFSSNPDVSQLISREYTYILSKHTPAQVGQNKIHRNSRFSSNSDVSPRIYHVISKQSFNIRTPAVHFSYRIPQQDRKERNLQEHPLFQPLYCARVCQLNRTYCPQG